MDFKGLSDPVVVFNKPSKQSIFQKLRPPSTNFLKSKKLLGGMLTVMLLFAVGLGVYISQKPTQLAPKASTDSAEISIKPSSRTEGLNQEFQSDVFLDTKGFDIGVTQVRINFDESKLQLLNVTTGDFFSTVLSAPVNTANSTTFSLMNNPAKSGSGKIATLTFKSLAVTSGTPTKIEFDTAYTQGTVPGTSFGVISQYTSSDITISASTSPSPSASTLLASPSPSSIASASPANITSSKGDGNSDGAINRQDLSNLFSFWSPATNITSHFELDFNDDKKINSFDYSKMNELLKSAGVLRQ